MNGNNNFLNLPIDLNPFVELISKIIDDKLKEHQSRLVSQSKILTREEVAIMCKVEPNTITKRVKEGKLINRGVGKKYLFLMSDIEDYLKYKNKN
jgi:hypothetical protein